MTDAERETAKDNAVRESLAERGDDGRTPRHTLFYLYGGDLEGMAEAAGAAGYKVGPTVNNDGLVLETTTAVDRASFEPHQRRMIEWVSRFGTEYDGWECAIVMN